MRRILLVLSCLFLVACAATSKKTEKVNGVSFVASAEAIDDSHIQPVVNINANYATIMPFGFIRDLKNPDLKFNSDRQWFGETKQGARQYIEALQAKGIKVMLKPQIWVWHGEYTGFINMESEAKWKQLEAGYTKFIMEFAEVAEATQCEILCIGTELEKFVEHRPTYWTELIQQIKTVYKGKLTYAANWDEYKRTPFWKDLDFIGIDAYFPVSDAQTPTVEACKKGWESHKATIKALSLEYNRPILFTEFGYRSVDYTGKEPWVSDRSLQSVNLQGQTNATQALFEMFWDEPWFAGGFIWKWFHNHDKVGGPDNFMFTPQNKPVEALLKAHFATH